MRFCFHPDAVAEFDRAVEYYEQCQPGLGLEFAEEVYAAIVRIIEYPEGWGSLPGALYHIIGWRRIWSRAAKAK
jgi:hypothetical protein